MFEDIAYANLLGANGQGTTTVMPQNSASGVQAADLAIVRQWIMAAAPR